MPGSPALAQPSQPSARSAGKAGGGQLGQGATESNPVNLIHPNSHLKMSLFCAISGQPPLHPVLSSKSGHVYEKELVLKYLNENDGKDPITGDSLSVDELVEIKTGK